VLLLWAMHRCMLLPHLHLWLSLKATEPSRTLHCWQHTRTQHYQQSPWLNYWLAGRPAGLLSLQEEAWS